MQHAEQSKLAAQITRLACHVLQGRGALLHQHPVAKLLLSAKERAQFFRDGAGDQEVSERKEPLALPRAPCLTLRKAALPARAVAAAMIGKALAAATIAHVQAAP